AAGGDAGRYGRMRQWGSIGFIAAVAATGPLLDWIGARRLTLPMGVLATLVLLVSWHVARSSRRRAAVERTPTQLVADSVANQRTAMAPQSPPPQPVSVWHRLREPRIALFFASCALMMFAHAALYAFFSLYLDRHGYAKTWIGAIWSLGVVAEIALFRWQSRLFERFGALSLLSFSMACAALRFALIGWGEGQWAVVLVSQLLHAITFGVHHSAAMALLHRWFEPGEQGRAQALFVTLGYGIGGSIGGLAAGWWWDHVSPAWAFYSAAIAAALGWVTVAGSRRFEYARAESDPRPAA
ncbi:MAG TPA: MFS transporter, partial [Burkholderiaceae bacterium]|nr:MFS transporter [Burkholderiaceae bacterium]